MPVFLLLVFRFLRLLLSGHQAVAIENTALRMQIAAFQRKKKRPLLSTFDRVFWITLRRLWSDWRHPLMYGVLSVSPRRGGGWTSSLRGIGDPRMAHCGADTRGGGRMRSSAGTDITVDQIEKRRARAHR